MELFKNLIYEYKKGMRDLALYTCESDLVEEFIVILEKMKIQYLFINLPKNKSNLFFGNPFCLEIVRRFSNKELIKFSSCVIPGYIKADNIIIAILSSIIPQILETFSSNFFSLNNKEIKKNMKLIKQKK